MLKKLDLILLIALLVGGSLRFVGLSQYPVGFTTDEAALGYNAYSILLTGKDEWSTPWWKLPFTNLRSFGDYKPPLYTLLTVPAVAAGGLSEVSVRFLSAAFGTLAILAVYLLAQSMYPNQKLKTIGRLNLSPAQIAALIFAISPWSISLSRVALEANLVTFILPLALYFFRREKYLLSAALFALNLYSYHSARIITPFVFLLFPLLKRPLEIKKLILPALLFTVLALPAAISYMGAGSGRLSDVGIFSPTDNWSAVADRRFSATIQGLPDNVSRVFSNKAVYTVSLFTSSLINYFSPEFFFTSGASEATYGMIPGRGVLYMIELPILLFFLVSLIRKFNHKHLFLLLMLVVGVIPAAMSKSVGFSVNRVTPMLPFIVIILSLGLFRLLHYFPKAAVFIASFLIVCYTVSLTFFIEDYMYHAPQASAPAMSYGWKEVINRSSPMYDRFSQVRFSRSLSEPHIFVAFYLKIDPVEYQRASVNWSDFQEKGYRFLDQMDGYTLGKFYFGDLKAAEPVDVPKLYVGRPSEFPIGYSEYFHIDYPDGKTAIQVSEKQP